MKTKRTVIAACIATLFISGTVFAKDNWEYHESGWNNVNSYGKVVIAQDSVNQWGPWEDFVEPAAGAPSPVAMPGMSGNDPYRTNPVTVVTGTDVCRSGDWCGYAVFRNYQWNYNNDSEDGAYTGPKAGLFGLTLTPDDPFAVTVDGGAGSGKVTWRLASITDVVPHFSNSGADAPATFGDWYYYYSTQGLHSFYSDRETTKIEGNTTTYDRTYVYGYPHDYYYYYWLPTSNKEVAVGWFARYVQSYVNGEGNSESGYWNEGVETYGYYVAGIATPQAYLDSQRAGNVVATYSGNSFDWYGGYQVPVNMTVNFGNATWSGSWNNGTDGNVYTTTDSKGNAFWYGQVGFNANGTINGANINSTSVSANDGAVTGSVKGTFYGQTAGSIGGVSDIVKTKTTGNSETRIATTTVTAPHTAIYLVNKVDLTPK